MHELPEPKFLEEDIKEAIKEKKNRAALSEPNGPMVSFASIA